MLEAERLKHQAEEVRLSAPRLTVGERIIEHLRELPVDGLTYMDTWPVAATQDGISQPLGISRAHAALELKRLLGRGCIEQMKAHVAGGKLVRRVYRLSPNPLVVYSQAGQPLPIVKGTVIELKLVVMRCPRCGSQAKVAME